MSPLYISRLLDILISELVTFDNINEHEANIKEEIYHMIIIDTNMVRQENNIRHALKYLGTNNTRAQLPVLFRTAEGKE